MVCHITPLWIWRGWQVYGIIDTQKTWLLFYLKENLKHWHTPTGIAAHSSLCRNVSLVEGSLPAEGKYPHLPSWVWGLQFSSRHFASSPLYPLPIWSFCLPLHAFHLKKQFPNISLPTTFLEIQLSCRGSTWSKWSEAFLSPNTPQTEPWWGQQQWLRSHCSIWITSTKPQIQEWELILRIKPTSPPNEFLSCFHNDYWWLVGPNGCFKATLGGQWNTVCSFQVPVPAG